MTDINPIEERRIRRPTTTLRTEDMDGQTYHIVEFPRGENSIMPAPFLRQLMVIVDDVNFAFGVVDSRFIVLFRNRPDAKKFQKLIRQVLPPDKEINR